MSSQAPAHFANTATPASDLEVLLELLSYTLTATDEIF